VRRVGKTGWLGGGLVLVGVGGVAAAITAVFTALPAPAAGGTCGPGRSSEPALFAFFNPGSIGAGPQPAVTNTAAHSQWLAFIGECQSATDARILSGLFVLVIALLVVAVGLLLSRRGALWGGGPSPSADAQPADGPSSSGDAWPVAGERDGDAARSDEVRATEVIGEPSPIGEPSSGELPVGAPEGPATREVPVGVNPGS
jgi:hypothetical protein